MPFNNAIHRLILAQGPDGEILLKLLDTIEALGNNKYTNEQLQQIISIHPKVAEFEVAVRAALLMWTSGVANNLVRYSVCNGFDAWRKLYNKYVPLAEDLRSIFIQELMALKPVGESELDAMFNEIERITDLYAKIGTKESISDQWIRAAILKNIPEKVAKDLAMDLRKATSADDMQHVINVYMHDHRTGLQRGVLGPMICATTEEENKEDPRPKETQPDRPTDTNTVDASINAATNGQKKGGKEHRKGYGQCWECGEMGHPRRECLNFLERMGKGQQQDISALNGTGKYGKGGKWSKGKGNGVKGNGYYGGKGAKGYTSLGKAIGKGLNYWGEDEYLAAWGNEHEEYYGYDYRNYGHADMNHVGDQLMLLEQCFRTQNEGEQHNGLHEERNTTTTTTTATLVTGGFDPLRNTKQLNQL